MATHKIVSWDEYCELSEADQHRVTVVTFTGLTECATLKASPAAPKAKGTLGVVRAGEDSGLEESDPDLHP